MSRWLVLAVALLGLLPASGMVTVASNLTWVENLWCDEGTGNLWLAESSAGTIHRVWSDSDDWHQAVHASEGIIKVAGVIVAEDRLFSLVNLEKGHGALIEIARDTPEVWTELVRLPRPILGDGLAYFNHSLYIAHEGDFLPRKGQVWRVDLSSYELTTILDHKFATDGAFVAHGVLYVSVVFGSQVIAIDLNGDPHGRLLGQYGAPHGVHILDDFCVTADNALVGASYGSNSIVRFDTHPDAVLTVVADHVHGPASVRQGCEGVGGDRVVFAAEGGLPFAKEADRRVLMIPL